LKKIFAAVLIQFVAFQITHAAPVVLQCATSEGQKVADLKVDIDRQIMNWGVIEYYIVQTDDTYITAYQKGADVGGEVWVINRVSGFYKRAAVGLYYDSSYSKGDEGTFQAQTYEGKCSKRQF